VHRAARELLSERSWSEVTMTDIAERADVHPATLYRRWHTFDGLVMDMVSEMWERLNPIPDSGSLVRDLEIFATRSVSGMNGTAGMMGVRALLMIRSERLERDGLPPAILKRRMDIEQMLDRAAARGETPPSVDQVLEGIVAPMYFRLLFGGETTKAYARVLVRRLLSQRSEAKEPTSGRRRT
jgi:AcrR family transcriptional regulator